MVRVVCQDDIFEEENTAGLFSGQPVVLQVAPNIKAKMMEEGQTMIGYQPMGDKVNFFRCVFSNPATQREDIDFLLDEIVRLGSSL